MEYCGSKNEVYHKFRVYLVITVQKTYIFMEQIRY